MTKTFYAIKYKESGAFFQWVELCEDGWGAYYPLVFDVEYDNLPTFFAFAKMPISPLVAPGKTSWDKGCSEEEVEFVPFELNW